MNYKYPLASINHSWLDRIKLAAFFLNPSNRWSMGNRVKEVESKLADETGYKYCVATSSGSTANTLLAMWVKENTTKRKIIVPAITWSTSVSPWITAGFEPIFVDVEKGKPVMDWRKVEDVLNENKNEVACIFHTTLLGLRADSLGRMKDVAERYGVDLYVDSCEDTAGMFFQKTLDFFSGIKNPTKAETTSFYLAHEFQACPEMGAVFTNDEKQYEFYLCARNHGMLRSLGSEAQKRYKNDLVDSKFDFPVIGNNFRPNEISAYGLLLDLKRIKRCFKLRSEIPEGFYYGGTSKIRHYARDYMFALPIVVREKEDADYLIKKIKGLVEDLGIECRPIVGGNLLRQTIFQKYGNYKDFPNSEWFHNYGIYIGLYKDMPRKILKKLQRELDKL